MQSTGATDYDRTHPSTTTSCIKTSSEKKKKQFTYRCGCTQIQGRNMSQLNALRQIKHPFQHKTITTMHKKITEKFRTNTGNSMKLSAVTGSPIYLLSLYLFSRTSTITRTLKNCFYIKTAFMSIWLNLHCWHICEKLVLLKITLHKQKKATFGLTKSISSFIKKKKKLVRCP